MTDPDNENVRLLGIAKSNLGRIDVPTRSFQIVPACVAQTVEGDVWTGRLEWLGDSARSIREATEAAAVAGGDRTATREAADWLEDYLTIQGGSADSLVIKRDGHKAGHSESTIHRARKHLNVVAKTSGFPRQSYWHLPGRTEASSGVRSGESEIDGMNETNGTSDADPHLFHSSQSCQTPRASDTNGGEDALPLGISPEAWALQRRVN